MEDQVKCPKCGSMQISADKKGFSGAKAVAGAAVTGGIGLLAGTIGSNKVKITCLKCGHVFNPGDKPIVTSTEKHNQQVIISLVFLGVCVFLALMIAIFH